MATRSLLKRIEQAGKAQGKFSPDSTCFPAKEEPAFSWPIENGNPRKPGVACQQNWRWL